MNLMGVLIPVVLLASIWGSYFAAVRVGVRMAKASGPGVVFAAQEYWGCVGICLLAVVGFGIAGLLSDLGRPGQLLPFSMLIGAFVIAGGSCLWLGWGAQARYDDSHVRFRDWRGAWHGYAWSDLRLLTPATSPGVKFKPEDRRSFLISASAIGALEIVQAAAKAGVAGAEAILAPPPRPGSR